MYMYIIWAIPSETGHCFLFPPNSHQQMTRNLGANSQGSQVSIVFLSSSPKPALAAPQWNPMELQYLQPETGGNQGVYLQ